MGEDAVWKLYGDVFFGRQGRARVWVREKALWKGI